MLKMVDMIAIWAFLGTINLSILTYQDMRKMRIDDRYNWYMYGANSIFIGIIKPSLFFIIVSILASVGFNVLWNKLKVKKALESGDISALVWVGIGFLMVDIYAALWFWGIFICVSLLYLGLKTLVFKSKDALPFFPVILSSFVSMCLVHKLY